MIFRQYIATARDDYERRGKGSIFHSISNGCPIEDDHECVASITVPLVLKHSRRLWRELRIWPNMVATYAVFSERNEDSHLVEKLRCGTCGMPVNVLSSMAPNRAWVYVIGGGWKFFEKVTTQQVKEIFTKRKNTITHCKNCKHCPKVLRLKRIAVLSAIVRNANEELLALNNEDRMDLAAEIIASRKSEKRAKRISKTESFFQTINAASELTKHLQNA